MQYHVLVRYQNEKKNTEFIQKIIYISVKRNKRPLARDIIKAIQ